MAGARCLQVADRLGTAIDPARRRRGLVAVACLSAHVSSVGVSSEQQLQSVTVAVDLSRASEQILRRTMLLPLAPNARVDILHVMPAGMPKMTEAAVRRRVDERLGRLARLCEGARRSARQSANVNASVGQPYVEIIRHSRATGADLVVVGREGKKRLRDRMGVGSTPKRVVQKGDVPTLVVALEPAAPYRRAVVAVDLSDASRRVIDLARQVAPWDGSVGLSLVHAYRIPFEGWIREDGLGRDFKEQATAELRRLHEMLGGEARGWRLVLRKGDPRVVIVREVQRQRADLIVLGTHGRSGISHALVGSVAEWVIGEVPCDVVITRPTRYCFELP